MSNEETALPEDETPAKAIGPEIVSARYVAADNSAIGVDLVYPDGRKMSVLVTSGASSRLGDGAWSDLVAGKHGPVEAYVAPPAPVPAKPYARPARPRPGEMVFDPTLGKPVWWNSVLGKWADATGAAA